MKVALCGMKGDFVRVSGEGIRRYMYELYTNLINIIDTEDEVDKVESNMNAIFGTLQSGLFKLFRNKFSKYDIIHNLYFEPLYRINNTKSILLHTFHDFQPILAPELNSDKVGLSNRIWLNEVIIKGLKIGLKSDYAIAVSSLTKEDAIEMGYNKNRIFVVNNGLDDRYTNVQIKKKTDRRFRVGYLGAFRARKNFGFAFDAFRLIDDKDMLFDVFGDERYQYNLFSEKAKKDKRIRFMGFAPHDRLVDIYDSFDVFVFPSLYEGFGIPIIEAQARGVPVIIYKNGKIPEEVRKYCFEARDSEHMAQIINDIKDKGYNKKKRDEATRYARTFTWKRAARETLEVYREIMKSSTE